MSKRFKVKREKIVHIIVQLCSQQITTYQLKMRKFSLPLLHNENQGVHTYVMKYYGYRNKIVFKMKMFLASMNQWLGISTAMKLVLQKLSYVFRRLYGDLSDIQNDIKCESSPLHSTPPRYSESFLFLSPHGAWREGGGWVWESKCQELWS